MPADEQHQLKCQQPTQAMKRRGALSGLDLQHFKQCPKTQHDKQDPNHKVLGLVQMVNR